MNTTTKEKRIQRKRNELGSYNPSCSLCGEQDMTMLIPASKSIFEEHHICGNHDGETIVICRNCHARLTDEQLDWPTKIFDNNRPLEMKAIGFFLGLASILEMLATLCKKYAKALYNLITGGQGEVLT